MSLRDGARIRGDPHDALGVRLSFLLILGGVYELLLSVENGGTVLFEGWPPLFVEGDGSFVRGF